MTRLIHIYLRKNQLVIPEVVRTEAGTYIDAAPVVVADIAPDEDLRDLKGFLSMVLVRKNADEDTSLVEGGAHSVILEALGLKKWKAFEQDAFMYTIHFDDAKISMYSTAHGPDKMWIEDKTRRYSFEPDTDLERIVQVLLDQIAQDRFATEPVIKPLALPPPS